MWDSGGDIHGTTVLIVDDDPVVGPGHDMTVSGKIYDKSVVVLVSLFNSIIIEGKIDEHSNVTLRAPNGTVRIGSTLGDMDAAIDNNSQVEVAAGVDIALASIHNSTVDFAAHGKITMGEIDFGGAMRLISDGDIDLKGKIAGNQWDHGPSRVDFVSNMGSITIEGKIDGQSKVYLSAGQNIGIGVGPTQGDDDRKIDDDSVVAAVAGGNISLGSWIRSGQFGQTTVDLAAAGSISIAKDISGGATVRMLSGSGTITVGDPITDSSTTVTVWPSTLGFPRTGDTATFLRPTSGSTRRCSP